MTYLAFILKFWRECIIALLAFLLLVCLFILNHQAKRLNEANAKCDARIEQIKTAQHQAQAKQQDQVNEVSSDYEADKAQRQIETQVIYKTIEKVVDRPVYRNLCIDDDGLSTLNSLIEADNPK